MVRKSTEALPGIRTATRTAETQVAEQPRFEIRIDQSIAASLASPGPAIRATIGVDSALILHAPRECNRPSGAAFPGAAVSRSSYRAGVRRRFRPGVGKEASAREIVTCFSSLTISHGCPWRYVTPAESPDIQLGSKPLGIKHFASMEIQLGIARRNITSGRQYEFPRRVNTSEKPAPTKFSKRVFVSALRLGSQIHFLRMFGPQ